MQPVETSHQSLSHLDTSNFGQMAKGQSNPEPALLNWGNCH